MAIQLINVGAAPNDGTGDLLRDAFIKCNNNFSQLEADIANIAVSVDISDIPGLQAELDALNAAIDALNTDVNAVEAAVTAINNSLTIINNAITALQQEDISINNSIASINNAITNINNILNDLLLSAGIPEAPNDGLQYARQNLSWTQVISGGGGGIPEAPVTGEIYGRINAAWGIIPPPTPSQLELISEGLGPNNGWRLLGTPPGNYGDIGSLAVDLSQSNEGSTTHGATGSNAFATGLNVSSSGFGSFASGVLNVASGDYSHVEGLTNNAIGLASHAEGSETNAEGNYSHTEGIGTIASGQDAHAEGQNCIASGPHAHAEGGSCVASGAASHSEGFASTAVGTASHAEGFECVANGSTSHAGGSGSIANCLNETVIGSYPSDVFGNAISYIATDTVFRVGIAPNDLVRRDGLRLYKNGALYLFPNTAASITNGQNGFFMYNDTTKKLASHDGTAWKDYAQFGTTAPATPTSTGTTGEIRVTATHAYFAMPPICG